MNKKTIFYIIALLLVLLFLFNYTKDKGVTTLKNVDQELSIIQKVASDYKAQTGNFGRANTRDNGKCFSGETFLKSPRLSEVFTSSDVDNISCVFGVATGTDLVTSWSVTIVKGEKTFCEDSTGVRRETPGLTTTDVCNAE